MVNTLIGIAIIVGCIAVFIGFIYLAGSILFLFIPHYLIDPEDIHYERMRGGFLVFVCLVLLAAIGWMGYMMGELIR